MTRRVDFDRGNPDSRISRARPQVERDERSEAGASRRRSRAPARSTSTTGQEGHDDRFTRSTKSDEVKADRAVWTRKQEEMRHPPTVWIDPAYADEPP